MRSLRRGGGLPTAQKTNYSACISSETKVPDDTRCISGLLCGEISQGFGQRFVIRLPPELLVMMQRADDGLARESDPEITLLQHLQQARCETFEHLWLIRREFDGGGVVAGEQEAGVDADAF